MDSAARFVISLLLLHTATLLGDPLLSSCVACVNMLLQVGVLALSNKWVIQICVAYVNIMF